MSRIVNYDRAELGERLAADYVLGLMPRRARQRFERAMAGNATLAARVAGWSDRFTPLDTATGDEAPPARIWQAIERRLGPAPRPQATRRVGLSLFWRISAASLITACAALIIYLTVAPMPLPATVEALAERTGLSWFIESAGHNDIGLSTIRLGVSERERPRWIRAALLLTNDAAPMTAEPPKQ
jgi:anti-sigma-K factor RskA